MGIRRFFKNLFNRASSSGSVEAREPDSPSSTTAAATTIPAPAPAPVPAPVPVPVPAPATATITATAPDSAPPSLPEISVSAPTSAATTSGSFPDVVRFGPTSGGIDPTLSAFAGAAASGSGPTTTTTTPTTTAVSAANAGNPVCVACRCPFVERMNHRLACVLHPGQVWFRNTQDQYAYVPTLGVQDYRPDAFYWNCCGQVVGASSGCHYRHHTTTRSRAAPRASPARMQFRGEEPSVWG